MPSVSVSISDGEYAQLLKLSKGKTSVGRTVAEIVRDFLSEKEA
jgi:predicted CopG family antitoxin